MSDILQENRKRYDSAMTYQDYLDIYEKLPQKPTIRPKETPTIPEALLLEPPKGPKVQALKLEIYGPDDVIIEESETDEQSRLQSPTNRPIIGQKALLKNNIRIRSQSENLGFSVYRFLQNKSKNTKQ